VAMQKGDAIVRVHKEPDGSPIKMWVDGVEVEHQAFEQLIRVSRLPFIYRHVAVMPDVHLGIGATVGSVIPTVKAIVPAAVGVDIGCGMVAREIGLASEDLPDNLRPLRDAVESAIPVGREGYKELPDEVAEAWQSTDLSTGYRWLTERHEKVAGRQHPSSQLGTLGGGNHFIEVCLDERGRVWVLLHSGSRNIGNRIGTYFIDRAKEEMTRYHVKLPDQDLAYLPEGSPLFDDYVKAVGWAQGYARINREIMLARVLAAVSASLGRPLPTTGHQVVNVHHNYVQRERHFGQDVWVTRKGAVSAKAGELGIIPGSMGQRSYIVEGLGNAESFTSCSHGAGRRMSRGEAKRHFTLEDHEKATAGVECRKDSGVLDETPDAYKDLDAVMAAQADLVRPIHTLKAVLTVKG